MSFSPQTVVQPLDSGCHCGSPVSAVISILGARNKSAQAFNRSRREGGAWPGRNGRGLHLCFRGRGHKILILRGGRDLSSSTSVIFMLFCGAFVGMEPPYLFSIRLPSKITI